MSSKANRKPLKQGLSAEDGRRRRENIAMSIRKDKKEEGLAKRRNLSSIVDDSDTHCQDQPVSSLTMTGTKKRECTILDMPDLLVDMRSGDPQRTYEGVKGFRKLLSIQENPPVRPCIDCGAVAEFVKLLLAEGHPKVQLEATWALTNIASSELTKTVVEHGAVPHLVKLLLSADAEVREQSAWCLGNIAGDSAPLREIVLNHGALMPLLTNIAQPANLSLLQNCIWSLSNFCRGKPQPSLSSIMNAIPALAHILMHNDDQQSLIDATWALSYISDGDDNRIQAVVNAGVLPALIRMLTFSKPQVITPALRTIGNIVTGNDVITQTVLNAGLLIAVPQLLENPKKPIRKETCWMLSNIAAGTPVQISTLMENADIMPRVIDQLGADKEWDVRKEACWVVCNIISEAGNKVYIEKLVKLGVIRQLCDILTMNEVHIVKLALCAIETILKFNDGYKDLIDEAEGIDKIEDLQNHSSVEIYQKASEIIEHFFGGEEEEQESQNIAPTSNGSTFTFGFDSSNATNFTGASMFGSSSSAPSKGFHSAAAAAPSSFGLNENQSPQQNVFNFAGGHQTVFM